MRYTFNVSWISCSGSLNYKKKTEATGKILNNLNNYTSIRNCCSIILLLIKGEQIQPNKLYGGYIVIWDMFLVVNLCDRYKSDGGKYVYIIICTDISALYGLYLDYKTCLHMDERNSEMNYRNKCIEIWFVLKPTQKFLLYRSANFG